MDRERLVIDPASPGRSQPFATFNHARRPKGVVGSPTGKRVASLRGGKNSPRSSSRSPRRSPRAALLKTRLCSNLARHGFCAYGTGCWFAHSMEELRRVPGSEDSTASPGSAPTVTTTTTTTTTPTTAGATTAVSAPTASPSGSPPPMASPALTSATSHSSTMSASSQPMASPGSAAGVGSPLVGRRHAPGQPPLPAGAPPPPTPPRFHGGSTGYGAYGNGRSWVPDPIPPQPDRVSHSPPLPPGPAPPQQPSPQQTLTQTHTQTHQQTQPSPSPSGAVLRATTLPVATPPPPPPPSQDHLSAVYAELRRLRQVEASLLTALSAVASSNSNSNSNGNTTATAPAPPSHMTHTATVIPPGPSKPLDTAAAPFVSSKAAGLPPSSNTSVSSASPESVGEGGSALPLTGLSLAQWSAPLMYRGQQGPVGKAVGPPPFLNQEMRSNSRGSSVSFHSNDSESESVDTALTSDSLFSFDGLMAEASPEMTGLVPPPPPMPNTHSTLTTLPSFATTVSSLGSPGAKGCLPRSLLDVLSS